MNRRAGSMLIGAKASPGDLEAAPEGYARVTPGGQKLPKKTLLLIGV